ncbi:MAG TPA: type II toxin-antitoxin system VapC family toxin [Chloroflexota bacterium]|nr:type II toxin-antitoxin system VapC family toxin [Chloroflexota bacterium]
MVLDAGPLIAWLYAHDADHAMAVAGFRELARASTRVLVPLPIVFEVYKWLLFEIGPAGAREGLARVRLGMQIQYPDAMVLDRAISVMDSMPTWRGTLEDALVAVIGLSLDVPVWTLNYRDLSAFPNLHFWTPSGA